MASISETGHAKNVAHFEDLIAHCLAYGTAYNPVSPAIQLTALQTLHAAAAAQVQAVIAAKTAYNTATNAREVAFQDIRKLSTRIYNAAAVVSATSQTLADIKSINSKIQGRRSGKKQPPVPPPDATGTDPTLPADVSKNISVSQQSFDSTVQHFASLIQALSAEPLYLPNETELQVATLTTRLAALQAANTAVITAATAYSNARIARNNLLYQDAVNLVNTAAEVKKYIKSVFGATSPQYRQISKIKFVRPIG